MNLTPVTSSQISALGYSKELKRCRIQFSPNRHGEPGAIYEYDNIEPEDFDALANAKSIGSHFITHIKPFPAKYPYRKLEREAEKVRG